MKIKNRAFTPGELEIISAANAQINEARKLVQNALNTLLDLQVCTLEKDIGYAKREMADALDILNRSIKPPFRIDVGGEGL